MVDREPLKIPICQEGSEKTITRNTTTEGKPINPSNLPGPSVLRCSKFFCRTGLSYYIKCCVQPPPQVQQNKKIKVPSRLDMAGQLVKNELYAEYI